MERKKKFKIADVNTLTLRYYALLSLIIILGLFFAIKNPAFISYDNLMNIVRQTCVTLIVSIGMTFTILTGGIDLSVGSNVAVSGMVGVIVLEATGSTVAAIFATLLCGTAFGSVNGFFVGKMRMTAFIVTLAMQFVGRGATMLLSGAKSIKVSNAFYKFIGQGTVMGLPTGFLIVIALYVYFCIINERKVFGRQLYAIGGNANAARASGIQVSSKLMIVYTLGGLIAGIAALVTVGRMGSAQPYAGQSLEFSCITAVVLGGTSLEGGKGKLKGTCFGALLVGIVDNGLSLMQVDKFFQYIATGLLVLIAVLSDMIINRYSNKKLIQSMESKESTAESDGNAMDDITIEEIHQKTEHVVEMKGITKVFPGMRALDNVDFTVRPYEVHALMGENGAGKSTLMRILSGEMMPTHGAIYIDGKRVNIDSAVKAKDIGIALIHQEIALVPELTVAQNIYLGKEKRSKLPFFLQDHKMIHEAQKTMDKLGLKIDVTKKAEALTVSEQQMVEIAKALSSNAWLVIMDEPTSSLGEHEKDELFKFIERMKEQGICLVYISHRMQEIFKICDTMTILRDGKLVGVEKVTEANERKLISMMVGRELNDVFSRERSEQLGNPVLEVRHLGKKGVFNDISFTVREKEVLGFSGLIGAGRTELARCIFGLEQPDTGEILLDGKPITIRSPKEALNKQIAYVPEDRKQDGFVPFMSIKDNIAMASYGELSNSLGTIKASGERSLADDYIKLLSVKTTSRDKNVVELSGGNQQKVALANRMATRPRVLILDEPTRGIDIGAKAEIHKLISEISQSGMAIILISSEMPELIGCADRVAVFREGVMTKLLEHDELDQDTIMYYAAQR